MASGTLNIDQSRITLRYPDGSDTTRVISSLPTVPAGTCITSVYINYVTTGSFGYSEYRARLCVYGMSPMCTSNGSYPRDAVSYGTSYYTLRMYGYDYYELNDSTNFYLVVQGYDEYDAAWYDIAATPVMTIPVEAAVAGFLIRDVGLNKTTCAPNGYITVYVTVQNYGDATGQADLTVKWYKGSTVKKSAVTRLTIPAGSEVEFEHTYSPSIAGTDWEVCADISEV